MLELCILVFSPSVFLQQIKWTHSDEESLIKFLCGNLKVFEKEWVQLHCINLKKFATSQTSKQSKEIVIDVAGVKRLVSEIEDDLKPQLVWINGLLKDAIDDNDDDDDDPDNGLPIVPYSKETRDALERPKFREILLGLGLQQPIEGKVRATAFDKQPVTN